jgi:hypothetical protein
MLRPQVRLTEAIGYLDVLVRKLDTDLANVHNAGAIQRYLDWVDQAGRELPDRFTDPTLTELLSTEHYWDVRRANDAGTPHLIAHELRAHLGWLREMRAHLQLYLPFADLPGSPVILDTNVLLHFDPFREEIDQARWLVITRLPPGAPLRVIIAHQVLDELDKHSHSGDKRLARRAREVQRTLDAFMDDPLPGKPREVRPGASWMTLEVLPDPPGHRRQGDEDTEILDRAEFLAQVTGTPVTCVTADAGMRVRGRVRELLAERSNVRMVAMPPDLRLPD